MQNLKFGVLVCGLLGVIGCFLPQVSMGDQSFSFFSMRQFIGAGQVFLVLGAYAVGAAMGGMGAAKGMQRWMSIVALVAFGLVLFKMRDALPFDIFKGAIGAKLMGVGAMGGVIFSILTIAKPEPTK